MVGANGWPKAFDPYGTCSSCCSRGLDAGLSWYTPDCTADLRRGRHLRVTAGTRTGPSRNFAAPDGTVAHTPFPRVDEVRARCASAATRTTTCSQPYEERAGVPGHRPEHGRRLRHGLRRPRQRPRLLRREAGHQELAGVLSRHQRRRLHRHLGRPPLLHLRRQTRRPGRPAGARSAYGAPPRPARCSPGRATSTRASRATAR